MEYNREPIGKPLVQQLLRAGRPIDGRTKYVDADAPKFFIRHTPAGAVSYSVQLTRSRAKSLGDVRSWTHPKDARNAALDMLKRFRDGVPIDQLTVAPTGKPTAAAPKAAGLTLAQMFGLRAEYAAGGVDVAGIGKYATCRDDDQRTAKTMDGQLGYLMDRFVQHVGESKPLADVTTDDVRGFLDAAARRRSWTGERVKGLSIVRYLILIRGAFAYAIERKQLSTNPCVGIRIDVPSEELDKSKHDRWLLPDEEQQLRDVLAARDRDGRASGVLGQLRRASGKYINHATPLVLLMLNTGGRPKSLFNLRWSHIQQLPYHRVEFVGEFAKKRQTYFVPLNREARDVLAAWKPADAKPNDLVFPGLNGAVLRTVAAVWKEIRSLADLDDVRLYDLRHTFASKLVIRNISLFRVSKLMGHKSQQQTERYAHLSPESGIDAVESLNRPTPKPGPIDDAALAVEMLNQPDVERAAGG